MSIHVADFRLGAQSTIMTKQCAEACGIANLIDTRFAGQAVGVGTGVILGRIHLAEMKIGKGLFAEDKN